MVFHQTIAGGGETFITQICKIMKETTFKIKIHKVT
jgi:hypothetical protein